jgi:hypothetical protein
MFCIGSLTIALVATSSPSWAATIFNNFGPGDTCCVTDSDITGPFQLGFQFSVAPTGPDYNLSNVIIPLNSETAPTTTNLFLAIDDAGVPGAIVASFATINVLNTLPGDIFSVAPLAPTTLLAGESYWLVNSPPPGVEVGWGTYAGGAFLNGAFRSSSTGAWSSFNTNVAFRIEGTPIPEPSTALLLGIGLAALSAGRSKN